MFPPSNKPATSSPNDSRNNFHSTNHQQHENGDDQVQTSLQDNVRDGHQHYESQHEKKRSIDPEELSTQPILIAANNNSKGKIGNETGEPSQQQRHGSISTSTSGSSLPQYQRHQQQFIGYSLPPHQHGNPHSSSQSLNQQYSQFSSQAPTTVYIPSHHMFQPAQLQQHHHQSSLFPSTGMTNAAATMPFHPHSTHTFTPMLHSTQVYHHHPQIIPQHDANLVGYHTMASFPAASSMSNPYLSALRPATTPEQFDADVSSTTIKTDAKPSSKGAKQGKRTVTVSSSTMKAENAESDRKKEKRSDRSQSDKKGESSEEENADEDIDVLSAASAASIDDDESARLARARKQPKARFGLGGQSRLHVTFHDLGRPGNPPQTFGTYGQTIPDGLCGTHTMYSQDWKFKIDHGIDPSTGKVVLTWTIINLSSNTITSMTETSHQASLRQTKGKTICNVVMQRALRERAGELEESLRQGRKSTIQHANIQALIKKLRPSQCTEGLLFFGLRHDIVQRAHQPPGDDSEAVAKAVNAVVRVKHAVDSGVDTATAAAEAEALEMERNKTEVGVETTTTIAQNGSN